MIKTVIGSFDSADDADRATRDLRNAGFADTDINLVVSNVRCRTYAKGPTASSATSQTRSGASPRCVAPVRMAC